MATWLTKITGDTILPGHINDLQTIKVDGDGTATPKFIDTITGDGDRAFDNFFRSDRLLQADVTASGHTWALTGAGAATAAISNHAFIATGNTYAYLAFGRTITKYEGVFSFGPNDTGIAMIADHSNDLQSMLHLNIYPAFWALTKRVSGEAPPWTEVLYGFYNLLTDGTKYRFSISISGNTVTVVAPDGKISSATDADIGIINPQYVAWQITGANSGTWHMVSIGETRDDVRTILGGAAPLGEVGWLRGTLGAWKQRVSFTTPATVGWYRIATAASYATFAMMGKILISARDIYIAQTWELFAACVHSDAAPILVSHLGGQNGNIDQVRLSTSTGVGIGLDIHLANARATEIVVDFTGMFTPVPTPVEGATVLPTGAQIRSFMENSVDVAVAKAGGGTRTLHFVGGIYTGYTDS